MNLLKKFAIIMIVVAIVIGGNLVMNFYDSNQYVCAATDAAELSPTPTGTPTVTPGYTLTVAIVLPVNGGSIGNPSITVDPPGTTVYGPTTFRYEPGTIVTLTANGTGFSSWSIDLSGSQNPATVTMDGNKTVYAYYTGAHNEGIRLQMYNANTSAIANTLHPYFRIINTGVTPLALASVKIRYYYTVNGDVPQNFYCDYSQVGSQNVLGTFVKLKTPTVGADYYLEIGFSSAAGSLPPGASIDVQTRIAKADWTNYIQTDDYSFNTTATTYVDWDKITGYINNYLRWGVAP